MRQKYPQVRESNQFANDNYGYQYDKNTRYKQMNIQPSFPEYSSDDLVHVEFRGYDGLPNPDKKEYNAVQRYEGKHVSGFGAVVDMKMLTYYIEDLCDEFAIAFQQYKMNPLVFDLETAYNEIRDELFKSQNPKFEKILENYSNNFP